MKKLSIVLLIVVMLFVVCMFAGCDNKDNQSQEPDRFENIQVGYKVDVYPNFPFDYLLQVDEQSYSVHIESIDVTLAQKHTIQEGEIVSGKFFPYTFNFVAKANTSSSLAGREIYIFISGGTIQYYFKTIIKENGEIKWKEPEEPWNLSYIPEQFFLREITVYV